MGASLNAQPGDNPWFSVQAARDEVPLSKVQIIKGEVKDGRLVERVVTLASFDAGRSVACVIWQDPAFDASIPAYWYVRVLEVETPRWSKRRCERTGLCEEFPEADQMVVERAWSSPVWQLP